MNTKDTTIAINVWRWQRSHHNSQMNINRRRREAEERERKRILRDYHSGRIASVADAFANCVTQ